MLAELNIALGVRKERLTKQILREEKDYRRVPKSKRKTLKILHDRYNDVAATLGEVFDGLTNNPCHSCPPKENCCRGPGMAYGYFHRGDFHEDVLNSPRILLELIVPFKVEEVTRDGVTPTSSRCIFLSPTGCNIPRVYRSEACMGYKCVKLSDSLGEKTPSASELFRIGSVRESLYQAARYQRKKLAADNTTHDREEE